MNKLTTMNNDAINSYEFLQVINGFRVEAGENETRNAQFLERVIDELDISNCKTFAVKNNRGNKDIQVVNLTKDEMMLVGMRESKVVRRKVLGYIKSLESKLLPSYQIINPVERARAWANEYETHVKEIEYKDEQIEYKDDTIIALTEDIDLEMKQKRISEIVKCKSPQQDRFRLLYIEFRNKYNIDIRKRYKNAVDKGTIKKYKTSKLQYACNTLNLTDLLFRFTVKLFETDAKEIYGRIVDVL